MHQFSAQRSTGFEAINFNHKPHELIGEKKKNDGFISEFKQWLRFAGCIHGTDFLFLI